MLKRCIALLLIAVLCCVSVGCHRDTGAGRVIQFETTGSPENIDPLMAASANEWMAVYHTFEPLLRLSADGAVIPAAAAEYTVSGDGLTYTFRLREDGRWSDEQPVTADDFVFALQRAVMPETAAACADRLKALVGARDVLAGKKPASELGAKAVDSLTLQLQLETPDDTLPITLTGAAGMPCRRDFFEAGGGRYGMTKDTILANGAFRVSRWVREEPEQALRLAKNEAYHDAAQVVPAGVQITYRSAKDRLQRLIDGDVDAAALSGDRISAASEEGLTNLSYFNQNLALVLNAAEGAVTANVALRKALLASIDPDACAEALSPWCEPCDSLILPDRYYGGSPYRPEEGAGIPHDLTVAHAAFEAAVEQLGADALNKLELLYADDGVSKPVLDVCVQTWQKEFGLYVKLTAVTEERLSAAVRDGSFTLALCPVSRAGDDPLQALARFSAFDPTFERLLKSAEGVGEGDPAALREAEARLLRQGIARPMFAAKGYYVFSPRLNAAALFDAVGVPNFSQTEKFS